MICLDKSLPKINKFVAELSIQLKGFSKISLVASKSSDIKDITAIDTASCEETDKGYFYQLSFLPIIYDLDKILTIN